MRLLFAVALLYPVPAQAITSQQLGLETDLGGGLTLGTFPSDTVEPIRHRFGAGAVGQGRLVLWWGNYDSSFALGRHWSFGVNGRYTYVQGVHRVAPLIELGRGWDLLALGVRLTVAGGVETTVSNPSRQQMDGIVLAGLTAKYRLNRNLAPFFRIQAGSRFNAQGIAPRVDIQMGFSFATRLKKPD